MKYETKPILSGAEIGRKKRCRHGAKPYEHCSSCDSGNLHRISLSSEELDVMLRALTFAADFQNDYYTLYPAEDYNRGNDRKQARGERVLAALRQMLGGDLAALDVARLPYVQKPIKGDRNSQLTEHIYTPRLKHTGERLRLILDDADWAIANRHRGTLRIKGIVTDQSTGRRYRIKGAACGLQCCCDATAEKV